MTNLEMYTCSGCNFKSENVNQREYPNQAGFVRGKHLATYMEIERGILYLVSDYHSIWNGSVFEVKKKARLRYHRYALFCDECVERLLVKERKIKPEVVYKHLDPYLLTYSQFVF